VAEVVGGHLEVDLMNKNTVNPFYSGTDIGHNIRRVQEKYTYFITLSIS